MELTKPQKTSIVMPMKWRPITVGVTLGLFLSALFTSNVAFPPATSSASSSSTSTSSTASFGSLFPWPTSSRLSSVPNQLLTFLFKSSPAAHKNVTSDEGHGAHGGHVVNSNMTSTKIATDHVSNGSRTSLSSANGTGEMAHHVSSSNSAKVHDNPSTNLSTNSSKDENANPTAIQVSTITSTTTHNSNATGQHAAPEVSTSITTASTTTTTIKTEANKNSVPPLTPNNADISSLLAVANSVKSNNTVKNNASHVMVVASSNESQQCDISIGKWVEDDSYPYYSPGSCPFIDEGFSCQLNGRTDSKYMWWRWVPRDCNVPRFNGIDFLEKFRGKRIVFVGDSLNRNQWESMLCMLRESLPDKSRIVQVTGGRITKVPGSYVFKFLDYDCKVEFYTSAYLVNKVRDPGGNESRYTIQLDRMDISERRWRKANVLIFNTGHWWTSDKIGDGENCFQEVGYVYPKLDVMVAYKKALATWARWVDKYVNQSNTRVFYRGYSPVHYVGGHWNSGGQCQDEKEPIADESFLTPYPDKMEAVEAVLRKMKQPQFVKVLNITRLSDYRKDAHPAIYGHSLGNPVSHQDCSHWCLPGLPDTWNELLYSALIAQ